MFGSLIDFYIGKEGQKKVRSCLETLWIKFSYVRLGNFGREEALFAVQTMDCLMGRRLFSVLRFAFVFLVCAPLIIFMWIFVSMKFEQPIFDPSDEILNMNMKLLCSFTVILFWMSLSFTRYYTIVIARLCREGAWRNFALFVISLFIAYLLMVISSPLGQSLSAFAARWVWQISVQTSVYKQQISIYDMISGLQNTVFHVAQHMDLNPLDDLRRVFYNLPQPHEPGSDFRSIFVLAEFCAVISLLSGLIRMTISVIFIGSYLLRPLYIPMLKTLAKVIESDMPVFGLLFGAVACVASGIKWLVHNS